MTDIGDRIAGCLVGGAIGDAMGVPFEGQIGPLQYECPHIWAVSDDTQLTLATCEALITEKGQVLPESIAREYCRWFQEGRITGVGASTLKSLRELEAGGHWALVGRKGEMAAGNGAAMRIASLGFFLNPRDDADRTKLHDVCRITHHNEEAYVGALAIVSTIHFTVFEGIELGPEVLNDVQQLLPDSRVRDRLADLQDSIEKTSIQDLGEQLGTSGYVVDSVPMSIAAATCAPRVGWESVMKSIIECGGDTDTIASMAGQIMGAACGYGKLPGDLLGRLVELDAIKNTAMQLCEVTSKPIVGS